jgi:uncharacterized protein YndB with AHSA1/START domain
MTEKVTKDARPRTGRGGGEAAAVDGTVGERVVERTLELSAPIERVWRAISDPAELSRWFGDQTRLEVRPGGDGAMAWDAHGTFAVRVEVVEPPRRLVWSWVHEPDVAFEEAPATRVEWTLTAREDGGTTLHLRESGFRTDLHHRQNSEGWREELRELEALLAT